MGKIIGKDCCCNDWKATIKELWAEYQNMIRSVKGNGITAYPDGDGQVDISAIVNSATINIDDALSLISTNPVQNKVITTALNDKVSTDDLSSVAISGDYDDLIDKPTIYANYVQASAPLTGKVGDVWYDNVNGDLYVCTANTPTWTKIISGTGITVAWGDITGSMANQSDLTNALNDKADVSSLSTVATTGDYDDLLNKPTIPAAPVQSDWNEADNTSLAYIQNKPTIPAAQVNSDWNAISGVAEILNKPTIPSGADLVPTTSGVTDGYVLTNDNGTPTWSAGGGGGATIYDLSTYTTLSSIVSLMDSVPVGSILAVNTLGEQYKMLRSGMYVKVTSTSWKGASEILSAQGTTHSLGYSITTMSGTQLRAQWHTNLDGSSSFVDITGTLYTNVATLIAF